jgi:hypothetical protein|tara:strand:- start:131 stop:232 length:102 start_codon:yes stop_codon:yes gene_type:complete
MKKRREEQDKALQDHADKLSKELNKSINRILNG